MAEIELAEAAQFHDERQSGLGRMFLDAIVDSGERILNNPEMYAFYAKPIRSCRVWPFSYRLLYRELPDHIQIVAVFHLSRRPGSWKDRLA